MDWFNVGSLFIVTWVVVAFCIPDWRKVVWPKLEQEKAFQHIVLASFFLITVLWSAQAGVKEGLQIHFLALTTLTMMYGWRMAFFAQHSCDDRLPLDTRYFVYLAPELSCAIGARSNINQLLSLFA